MKAIRIFISIMIVSLTIWADEVKIEKVIVTGVGIDKEKAMKNASQSAVQQVVGSYVVSDSLVANGKLIKDEVLSQSNGYVRSFKTLKEGKDEDGLYQLEAEVEVEVGKLTNKLGSLNIAMKNIQTDDFMAVSMDKFSSSADFMALAEKVIFEPLQDKKKVYDIKILQLQPLDTYNDNMFYWHNKDKEKKQAEDGSITPFELTFKVSLNDTYIASLKSFFTNVCEAEGGADVKFISVKNGNDKLIKGFTLSEKNLRQLNALMEEKLNAPYVFYYPELIIDLLGDSEASSKKIVYSPVSTNMMTNKYLTQITYGSRSSAYDSLSLSSSFHMTTDPKRGISHNIQRTDSDIVASSEILSATTNKEASLLGIFGFGHYDKGFQFYSNTDTYSIVVFLSPDDVKEIKKSKIEVVWQGGTTKKASPSVKNYINSNFKVPEETKKAFENLTNFFK